MKINGREVSNENRLTVFGGVNVIESDDLFCIPTAEVPVTNLYANEVLKEEELPLKHVAYSTNYRVQSGSLSERTTDILR